MANTSYPESDKLNPEFEAVSIASNKLPSQIESYSEQQNLILEYLKKTEAQAIIALSDDFLDYDSNIIHYYLCALSDSLEITTRMFEGLQDDFIQIKKYIS